MVDEELQNHLSTPQQSEGMNAALHGIWAGRAIWRAKKQKELDAKLDQLGKQKH